MYAKLDDYSFIFVYSFLSGKIGEIVWCKPLQVAQGFTVEPRKVKICECGVQLQQTV